MNEFKMGRFSSWLRRTRRQRGLDPMAIGATMFPEGGEPAEKAANRVKSWEAGRGKPKHEDRPRLAGALGVSVDEINDLVGTDLLAAAKLLEWHNRKLADARTTPDELPDEMKRLVSALLAIPDARERYAITVGLRSLLQSGAARPAPPRDDFTALPAAELEAYREAFEVSHKAPDYGPLARWLTDMVRIGRHAVAAYWTWESIRVVTRGRATGAPLGHRPRDEYVDNQPKETT